MTALFILVALLASAATSALGQSCPTSAITCYTSPQGPQPQTQFCCPTPSTSCSGLGTTDCVATGTNNVVAGAGFAPGKAPTPAPPTPAPITDNDILNFLLNLVYVQAEFYQWAAFGHGLDSSLTGGGGPVNGGQNAQLSSEVQALAAQLANDEANHVKFLGSLLGSAAISEPALDIGSANAAAGQLTAKIAFNVSNLAGPPFNPYAGDAQFLLGALAFEETGVSAYSGQIAHLSCREAAENAARLLGVEGFHAGAIRIALSAFVKQPTGYGSITVGQFANAISQFRAVLGGDKETPLVGPDGIIQIRSAKSDYSLTYARTPSEVIGIVTGGLTKGLYFPDGLKGRINA